MEGNRSQFNNSPDTFNCLRSVDACRRWRTLMVLLLAVCLLLLQVSFYLVNLGYITIPGQPSANGPTAADNAEEANPVLRFISKGLPVESISRITFEQLTWAINLVNAVLILAAAFYCLTLLIGLNISISGRLGGIKHIARASLLSLLMFVLLLPWQRLFDGVVTGAMFTPDEMAKGYSSRAGELLDIIPFYLRFSGYGLSLLLLLIFSYVGSLLWVKAIVRRLTITQMETDLTSAPRPVLSAKLPGRVATQ